MLVKVIERKRYSFLGPVDGPAAFGSSARPILPINVGYKATQGSPRLPIAEVSRNSDNDGLRTQRRDINYESDTVLCMHPSKSINTNKQTKGSVLLLLLSKDDPTLPDLSRSFITTLNSHKVEQLSVTSFNSPINKGNLSST